MLLVKLSLIEKYLNYLHFGHEVNVSSVVSKEI